MRRVPAVAELQALRLAVWPGEVVLVAGAPGGGLSDVLCALHAVAGGRVRAAMVTLRGEAEVIARALVGPVSATTAVVAAVSTDPGASERHAIEGLRRAVACIAPCRCVWMVHGRVYPWRGPARLLPASAPL